MNVRYKERMPDADLREFVMPETLLLELTRGVAVLDQHRNSRRTDHVDIREIILVVEAINTPTALSCGAEASQQPNPDPADA